MAQPQLQVMETQPSQPYIAQAVVTPDQALQAYKTLKEITKKALTKGVDYDTIPGTPKPSLLKSGAENLLRFYGLGHKVQKTHAVEDWENGFFHYEFKVTVHKTFEDGREVVLSECYGSANSKEPKFYKKKDGSLRNPYEQVNTLKKMAIKRALVGAALQATGASGLFTQDVEDMEIDAAETYNSPKQNGNRQATDKQVNFIKKLAQDKGVDDNLLNKMLEKGFNTSSVNELTSQAASKVIKLLQERSLDQIKEFVGVEEAEQVEAEMVKDVRDAVESVFEGETVEVGDDEWPFD